ncbi:MAG: PASTA domain-containing protein [bacterium]|nr:PASTA domain-containing protein [bacterium]
MFDNTGKIIGISVIVSLIISIVVSLATIVFIAPLIKPSAEKQAEETKVEVPLIEGNGYERAKLFLENKGLTMFVESEKTSETEEKGVILSQSPIAGAMVLKGSSVSVVISAGKEIEPINQDTVQKEAKLVILPYFTGLNVDEVKREIIKLRLKIGNVGYVDNEKYRTDVVVSTVPEGGTEMAEGSSVNITVSKGTVSVAMPNVNSLTKADALEKIRSAGLTVDEVINMTDTELPFDIVVKQSPEPGVKIKKGTGVKIWMNTERK